MTKQQIEEFREWHIQRLADLKYPPEIVLELNRAREKWISKVRVKRG
jgi:hypothetical protein